MKVLVVHNSYQRPGGEDQVFAAESQLLKSHGHEVVAYQASNTQLKGVNPLVMVRDTIWSRQSHRQLKALMRRERPRIVHAHNIFPVISPAVYYAAREEGIPVVQTLHNYRLLCPSATLFRDGHTCEDCVGKRIAWPGIVHGCYRCSKLATGATAAMLATHSFMQTWTKTVSAYIALSVFARNKFIQGGLSPEKIFVKPNFLQDDPGVGEGSGSFALFVGRLTPEKGISTLLQAWREFGPEEMPLQIAGDGPEDAEVARACNEMRNVTWLKWLPRTEILEKMKQAAFLVVPSAWYEGFPMILTEAFAAGLPVIASNLGSMSSIVDHRRTGLHFQAGNSADLVAQVRWLRNHPAEVKYMRQQARLEYEAKYTGERNYAQLMEIYSSVLTNANLPDAVIPQPDLPEFDTEPLNQGASQAELVDL